MGLSQRLIWGLILITCPNLKGQNNLMKSLLTKSTIPRRGRKSMHSQTFGVPGLMIFLPRNIEVGLSNSVLEKWFCGAGTSGYIGDILTAGLPNAERIRFRSIPSTDLVSRAEYYLEHPPKDLLIVNFGRSGNSSETVGTLRAIEVLAPSLPALNIMHSNSAMGKSSIGQCILLPDACHDAGFAMTSSFSTMLLTAFSIFDTDADARSNMRQLAKHAEAVLPLLDSQIRGLKAPTRAVFVGSGPMTFAARECALKVLELSAAKFQRFGIAPLAFAMAPRASYQVVQQFTFYAVLRTLQQNTKSI